MNKSMSPWLPVNQQYNGLTHQQPRPYIPVISPNYNNIFGLTRMHVKLLVPQRNKYLPLTRHKNRNILMRHATNKYRFGYIQGFHPGRVLQNYVIPHKNHRANIYLRTTNSPDTSHLKNYFYSNLMKTSFGRNLNIYVHSNTTIFSPTQHIPLKNNFDTSYLTGCIDKNAHQSLNINREQTLTECKNYNTEKNEIDHVAPLPKSFSKTVIANSTYPTILNARGRRNNSLIKFPTTQKSHYVFTINDAITSHTLISRPLTDIPQITDGIKRLLSADLTRAQSSMNYTESTTVQDHPYFNTPSTLDLWVESSHSGKYLNKPFGKNYNDITTEAITPITKLPKHTETTTRDVNVGTTLLTFDKKRSPAVNNSTGSFVFKRTRMHFTKPLGTTRSFAQNFTNTQSKTISNTKGEKYKSFEQNFNYNSLPSPSAQLNLPNKNVNFKKASVRSKILKSRRIEEQKLKFPAINSTRSNILANFSVHSRRLVKLKKNLSEPIKLHVKDNEVNDKKSSGRVSHAHVKDKFNTEIVNLMKSTQTMEKCEEKNSTKLSYLPTLASGHESAIMKIRKSNLSNHSEMPSISKEFFAKEISKQVSAPELPIEIYFKNIVEPKE